jgi:hypothetical protein
LAITTVFNDLIQAEINKLKANFLIAGWTNVIVINYRQPTLNALILTGSQKPVTHPA